MLLLVFFFLKLAFDLTFGFGYNCLLLQVRAVCHRLAAIHLVLALTPPGAVPQQWAEDGAAELLVPGASFTSKD